MNLSLDSLDVARGTPCNSTATLVQFNSREELLFLYPNTLGVRVLFSYNIPTNELRQLLDETSNGTTAADATGTLSLAEELRRERMRDFSSGINTFEVVQGGTVFENRIMIPMPDGRIFIYDRHESFLPKLWAAYDGSQGVALDPHMSTLGDEVAFVLNDDIYIFYVFIRFFFIIENYISIITHRVSHNLKFIIEFFRTVNFNFYNDFS